MLFCVYCADLLFQCVLSKTKEDHSSPTSPPPYEQIAAHGNSLRALVKHLDNISEDVITGLNIPTGKYYYIIIILLVYEYGSKCGNKYGTTNEVLIVLIKM